MAQLTSEIIKKAKARGFLRNRGTDCFSGRVVSAGGVYTATQLARIAECAQQYGNGKIAFTSRLSAEIIGISYENLDAACALIESGNMGLAFGGTGAKIRPLTACKGTTCVFGCCDTQAIARMLHEQYYVGWREIELPHKFKIAVGGCRNSCIKPSLNDFGVEACLIKGRVLFKVFVGGTWGKQIRIGNELGQLVEEDKLCSILDGVLDWFCKNASNKERLGMTIDRVGMDNLALSLRLL